MLIKTALTQVPEAANVSAGNGFHWPLCCSHQGGDGLCNVGIQRLKLFQRLRLEDDRIDPARHQAFEVAAR